MPNRYLAEGLKSPLGVYGAVENAPEDARRAAVNATDFIPVVGGVKSAIEGYNRGNPLGVALGLGSAGADVAGLGLAKLLMKYGSIPNARRLLTGHSPSSITQPPAKLREVTNFDDRIDQMQDAMRAQQGYTERASAAGKPIPVDIASLMNRELDNAGTKLYEVLPSETNKRGWVAVDKNGYIPGILAESPGSGSFLPKVVNGLYEVGQGNRLRATAADDKLADLYRSQGVPVREDLTMKFAEGGLVSQTPQQFEVGGLASPQYDQSKVDDLVNQLYATQ